jgi:hypothetical protein
MAGISPVIVCPTVLHRHRHAGIPDKIPRRNFKRWRTWLVLADFRAARKDALKSHTQLPSKSDQSPRSSGRVSARPVPIYVR